MKATPTTAKATPMSSYGQFGPCDSSGISRPAPKLTASAVRPVRHQARYVRSFASRVRRVASRASSSPAFMEGSSSVVRRFLRRAPHPSRRRSDVALDCGHGLDAAVDHESDVELVLVAGHGELEPVAEVERFAEVEASA